MSEAVDRLIAAAARLKDSRKYLASVTAAKRAQALDPKHPLVPSTLGAVQWNNDDFDNAIHALRNSLARDPYNATDWAHLGLSQSSLQRWDEAEDSYERSLALNPDNLPVRWNRANFRLARGRWQDGLEDYESRIAFRGPPLYPKWPYPAWDGKADLNGKTVVLFGEQGVGDTILISRYVWWIKERYPDVKLIWFLQPRLHDLLWEFRDRVEFWPAGHPWPQADYGIFQMSLLKLLEVRPDNIIPDPGLLRSRGLKSKGSVTVPASEGSLKIGIAWTGNPEMMANEGRSIPVELLLSLAENPAYSLFALQVGPGTEHLHFVDCDELIRDCSNELATFGFAGTAALMLNLDLVITVCTSNAHLAGALGVPCWTLLSYDPYWVWLRESDRTAWYPHMELIRQDRPGDWAGVMAQVKDKLGAFAASRIAA